MKAQTKEAQAMMTPASSLQALKEGNKRFQQNLKADRNLLEQVKDTSTGQYPFATILSCIDSRVSSELIFDQGIGDIFSARVAGNFVNEDILGSMEFACKVSGAKLIIVMGHQHCGAVLGAINDVKLGNLTATLSKIKPAIAMSQDYEGEKSSKNEDFVKGLQVLRLDDYASTNSVKQSIYKSYSSYHLLVEILPCCNN